MQPRRWVLLVGSLGVAVACGGSGATRSGFLDDPETASDPSTPTAPPGSFEVDGSPPSTASDGGVDCDADPGACLPPAVCGDGKPGLGESCDDGNAVAGDGCSSKCQVEAPYWACAFGQACIDVRDCAALVDAGLASSDAGCVAPPKTPACGDGMLDPGEACDDGNVSGGDGCAFDCKTVEANWACPVPGGACVSTMVCGDGKITGTEDCDDKNAASGDGCSSTCHAEAGWTCPLPGVACVAKACGDGIVAGAEECDDGNVADGDGCSASCRLAFVVESTAATPTEAPKTRIHHYACSYPNPLPNPPKQVCTKTTCGNGVVEANSTEECDDGNDVPFDGCSPSCLLEPKCPNGKCIAKCGDGLLFDFDADGDGQPDEQCDDGNTRSGDGCSSSCKVEPGYQCLAATEAEPAFVDVPTIFRDFKYWNPADPESHPDFERYTCAQITPGLVAASLTGGLPTLRWNGAGGDPVTGIDTNGACGQQLTGAFDFFDWYRDVDVTINGTPRRRSKRFAESIRLTKKGGSFVFDSQVDEPYKTRGGFYPLDGRGWGNQNWPHNFAFTTEFRTWFTYDAASTPQLDFSGDDDVWVFLNGRLALDVGGLHPRVAGSFTLDAAKAAALGLVSGHLYEVALLHAERHTDASNFWLTLRGFGKRHSVCTSVCGDGIKTSDEQCDLGASNVDPSKAAVPYQGCTNACTLGPYCGDKVVTSPPETCDDGTNLSVWTPSGGALACAPGCTKPAFCGDGKIQSAHGERCDDGAANTDDPAVYGGCRTSCLPGPRCGDGIVQAQFGEACDNGYNVGAYVKHPGPLDCAPGCKKPRACGDGVVDYPFEQCDQGAANTNSGAYGSCTAECTLGPRCGDGIVQGGAGETCDDGNRINGDGCSASCGIEIVAK